MNSRKTAVLLLLLIVAYVPGNLFASDQISDNNSAEQTLGGMDISQPGPDQLDPLADTERPGIVLPELDIRSEFVLNPEVLDEIDNNNDCRLKSRDQQADILDELLLE